MLDLYARGWDGRRLGKRDHVISSDEKTSIQVRCQLAARQGHVDGRLRSATEPTTGIEPFGCLVEQVMTVEPYASAKRVFWVVDNGSSPRDKHLSTVSRAPCLPCD